MIHCTRTDSGNEDFRALVRLLDRELAERDGADHAFFAQFNKIDHIAHVVLAVDGDGLAVGCGALKAYTPGVVEVKRMFVPPDLRGRGIASRVLAALEEWARELGYPRCILETGERQPEAIALYRKNGYRVIPNYGQYAEVTTSVCFEKALL